MPKQNRVTPTGQIVATDARGAWMGNRGGKFHADGQLDPRRRWVSRRWITCALHFKDCRRNPIMGAGYTELFFMDEATALASGHRPCYECRRADAIAFAEAFSLSGRAKADAMDVILHRERLGPRDTARPAALPDGSFFTEEDTPWLVHTGRAHEWSLRGYLSHRALPDHPVEILTPASIRVALHNGYRPQIALPHA